MDCVLQFEGERERTYRTVRALKNRFGSTSETGVFEMRSGGLVEVLDASARFVGEATGKPGSVVLASMEGTRPLLVEVQALVSPSELVPPRRACTGIDRNRLALVLAVLGRHAGVGVGTADVFVNVAGGIRIDEPGADLAVALAVASAARGVPLQASPRACFGEVGLTGELRTVAHHERRLEEAAKFGLRDVVCPERAPTLRQALRMALRADESVGAPRRLSQPARGAPPGASPALRSRVRTAHLRRPGEGGRRRRRAILRRGRRALRVRRSEARGGPQTAAPAFAPHGFRAWLALGERHRARARPLRPPDGSTRGPRRGQYRRARLARWPGEGRARSLREA